MGQDARPIDVSQPGQEGVLFQRARPDLSVKQNIIVNLIVNKPGDKNLIIASTLLHQSSLGKELMVLMEVQLAELWDELRKKKSDFTPMILFCWCSSLPGVNVSVVGSQTFAFTRQVTWHILTSTSTQMQLNTFIWSEKWVTGAFVTWRPQKEILQNHFYYPRWKAQPVYVAVLLAHDRFPEAIGTSPKAAGRQQTRHSVAFGIKET